MSRTPTKKTFDCVEFKRKAQEEIYEKIKDLPPEKQREYFRVQADSGPLGDWWKAVKRRSEQERSRSAGQEAS